MFNDTDPSNSTIENKDIGGFLHHLLNSQLCQGLYAAVRYCMFLSDKMVSQSTADTIVCLFLKTMR